MKKTLLASTALVAAGLVVGFNQASAQTMVTGPGTANVTTQNITPTGGINNATPAAGTPRFVLRIGGRFLFSVGAVWQDDRGGSNSNALSPGGRPAGTAEVANVDQISDSRIQFDASINLDNGITAGWFIRWEIRGVNTATGTVFPRNYGYLQSARLGELRIGSQLNALGTMALGTVGAHQGRAGDFLDGYRQWTYFVINPTGSGTLLGGILDPIGFTNNGVGYYSPRIEGFQVGITWAAENSQDREGGGTIARVEGNQATYRHITAVSLNFDRTFEGVRVTASGGYLWAQAPRNGIPVQTTAAGVATFVGQPGTPHIWSAGGTIGYAGFRVGGHYHAYRNWFGIPTLNATSAAPVFGTQAFGPNSVDGDVWQVGGSYAYGPWAISISFQQARAQDCPLGVAQQIAGLGGGVAGQVCGGRDRQSSLALSGSYQLGPGVFWDATLFHTNLRGNSWNAGASIAPSLQFTQNNRATGFITGLTINF